MSEDVETEVRAFTAADRDGLAELLRERGSSMSAGASGSDRAAGSDGRAWERALAEPYPRATVAVDGGGALRAAYAGECRAARLDGEPARITLVTGLGFAHARPGARDLADAETTDPDLAVRLDRELSASFGGAPPEGDALFWALVGPREWRAAQERAGWDFVRTQLALERPVGAANAQASTGGVEVREVERFPDALDALWVRASEPFGAVLARDAASLEARFGGEPDCARAVVGANGELAGYAVFRAGALEGEPAGLVVDWLVTPGRADAAAALLAWLDERARAAGLARLVALFPDTSPEWVQFQHAGFRAVPTRLVLAAKSQVKACTMRWLYRRFHYTLGDAGL